MSRSFIWPIVFSFSAATAAAQSVPERSDDDVAAPPSGPAATAPADEGNIPAAPPPVEEHPVAPTPGQNRPAPSLDDFHQALDPHGRWVETPEYGLVWIPSDVGSQWRPYSNGQWENSDDGWVFVANESWGWAPFHYGRWVYYPSYAGWAWIPGYEYAPAWVTWRYSAGVVAWAPLGPIGVGLAYYGLPSLWLAVDWGWFFRPLVWGCFFPTTRIGGVFRSTYFAGVPRRGFYYAPPRGYFASAGGGWRGGAPGRVGGGRGWDGGRGWSGGGRGAPPRAAPSGRGPMHSAGLTPRGGIVPAYSFNSHVSARPTGGFGGGHSGGGHMSGGHFGGGHGHR